MSSKSGRPSRFSTASNDAAAQLQQAPRVGRKLHRSRPIGKCGNLGDGGADVLSLLAQHPCGLTRCHHSGSRLGGGPSSTAAPGRLGSISVQLQEQSTILVTLLAHYSNNGRTGVCETFSSTSNLVRIHMPDLACTGGDQSVRPSSEVTRNSIHLRRRAPPQGAMGEKQQGLTRDAFTMESSAIRSGAASAATSAWLARLRRADCVS
jgi:hypothetical protein